MTTEPTTPRELVQWILAPHRPIGSNAEFVRRIDDYSKQIAEAGQQDEQDWRAVAELAQRHWNPKENEK